MHTEKMHVRKREKERYSRCLCNESDVTGTDGNSYWKFR